MVKTVKSHNISIETMAPVMRGRARGDGPDMTDPRMLPDLEPDDALLFDGLLYPNRSLPSAGFAAIMAILITVNLSVGIFFLSLGAWPVLAFGGLDILLVWGAFKLSYRQGRMHERILVDKDEIWVARVTPSGHESRWRMQPYWTRVECDREPCHETQIRLISKGETLIVGAFLSPEERVRLGDSLRKVVGRCV